MTDRKMKPSRLIEWIDYKLEISMSVNKDFLKGYLFALGEVKEIWRKIENNEPIRILPGYHKKEELENV